MIQLLEINCLERSFLYRDRNYDPQVGRFLQKDPIGLSAGDTNLYRYVNNKPIKYKDPTGLLILDLTGDARMSFIRTTELYKNLNNDQNVLIVISLGNLGNDTYATALGDDKLIRIVVNPNMNKKTPTFNNTIVHELIHADQLRSGNFSYTDPSRRDFEFAEEEGYNYANELFPDGFQCK